MKQQAVKQKIFDEWDRMNGYRDFPKAHGSVRDSEINFKLASLKHNQQKVEKDWADGKVHLITKEQYIYGE